MNIRIVIPARKGSKGLPFKNRQLFDDTANKIPEVLADTVYVTTDDPEILERAKEKGFNVLARPAELATDDASVKDVLINVANTFFFQPDDIIIMLYLTYPQRVWEDVQAALDFYIKNDGRSMLCKTEWIGTHPALCMFEEGMLKGRQVFQHNQYRRQQYLPVFEISHFICMVHVSELARLNKNLYNFDTLFLEIAKPVDVDTKEDLAKLEGEDSESVDDGKLTELEAENEQLQKDKEALEIALEEVKAALDDSTAKVEQYEKMMSDSAEAPTDAASAEDTENAEGSENTEPAAKEGAENTAKDTVSRNENALDEAQTGSDSK